MARAGRGGMTESQIPRQILRIVELIKKHPGVEDARMLHDQSTADWTSVAVDVTVELPSRSMAHGESPNGVRSVETAFFRFRTGDLVRAPTIALREDFDRSLAHIIPGFPTGQVIPCVFDGDLSELLQRGGIWAIIDHLLDWLDKAATDDLIDRNQGWEPIRRDELRDALVARASDLQQYGEEDGPPFRALYSTRFFLYPISDGASAHNLAFYGTLVDRHKVADQLTKCFMRNEATYSIGCSIAIVIRPDKEGGRRRIADKYVPDTVTNSEELRVASQRYGCASGLESAFGLLAAWLVDSPDKSDLPLVVLFCANRPFRVIGSTSSVELVPYLTKMRASFDKLTSVRPVAHRDAVDMKLLRRFSGTEKTSHAAPEVAQLGCGSLGSKIAVHLARTGYAPTRLIDKAHLMPHHAVRHAILPPEDQADWAWAGSKANALSKVIAGLGQQSVPFTDDTRDITPGSKKFQEVFPRTLLAIVNSTASLSVREWLCALRANVLPTRILETCLYGNGRVGLISLEGMDRNPNSSDLAAYAHFIFSQTEYLRKLTLVDADGIARRLVGQGCGSPTMIVSDMRISTFAASMAQNINLLERSHLPNVGKIWIGVISEDQLGLNWQVYDLLPTQVLNADNAKGWTVRLLSSARAKIEADCGKYCDVETGGVVAGYVSETQRAVIVADLIPAPKDSMRSASKFVLGTKGLQRALNEYSDVSGGSLYCVGTWHSHLVEHGPSPTDHETAKVIAEMRPFPSAMLVRTPSQYRALVTNVG